MKFVFLFSPPQATILLFFSVSNVNFSVRALAEAFMFGRANRWSVGQAVTSVSVNLKSSVNLP